MSGRIGVIERRTLLLGAVASGLAGARPAVGMGSLPPGLAMLPVPPSRALGFRMMRHGSAIGTHTLEFDVSEDRLAVRIAADAKVSFGPIPLVRYTHRNTEVWQDGRLASLDAHTDRNGTKLFMSAHRTPAGLYVEGSGTKPYIAPEDALPTTYWNMRILFVPLIGVQNGTLGTPTVTEMPIEKVRLASGAETPARGYHLTGDINVDLWYDAAGSWMSMRFTVGDGSVITYERL